ncbi:hypothetical protein SLEP1_g5469 [Rubroshorea leprosula]|uniref:AT3G52170-like helix-turn-helix domain-containing protein n=1 Tax=Rubroshorea leprosula TaxID=152421 RepID=A0AAV5HXW3_9ROSI|nr:hypothetical protein SLEP1_g5469 [Rubroshorea leprosula]
MHAIKGAWVGQTFALAKSNESGGRKARIRRSKEERKAMVESFIKKYQRTNDGNFPSLNLTHKEVGGSFYTIREIVREIIQENRVLGPGKLIEEEQNAEQFLEQHPLGSISIEPKSSQPAPATGINFVPNHVQGVRDESVPSFDGLFVGSEKHKFDDEQVINGSAMVLKDETDKEVSAELEGNWSAMDLKDETDEKISAELEANESAMDLKDETDEKISAELEANESAMDLKDETDKNLSTELAVNGNTMDFKDESHKEVSAKLKVNGGAMDLKDESDGEVSAELEVNGNAIDLKDESHKEVSAELEVNGNAMDLKDESRKEASAELEGNGAAIDMKDKTDQESTELGVKEFLEESEKELTPVMSSAAPVVSEADESVKKFTSISPILSQITTDVIVETFPLRPVSKSTDYMDERYGEMRNLSETSEERENKKVDLDPKNGGFLLDEIVSSEKSSLVDDEKVGKDVDMLFEKNSNLVYNKVADSLSDPPLETSKQLTTTNSVVHGSHNGTTSRVDLSHNDVSTSTTNERSKATDGEVISSPNRIHTKSDSTLNGNASEESTTQEAVLVENKRAHLQHNANSPKTSNGTLDRINLKSWEATARGNASSETNPLLAFFKSFIAAFLKFWSE